MFGVIVSGRPVQTTFEAITPTQAQFQIPASPSFGHVVIFMLPGATLPEGQSAAIYIRVPPNEDFTLWGELSNTKQSAVFKIRESGKGGSGVGNVEGDGMDDMIDESSAVGGSTNMVTIGIAIEPSGQVTAALTARRTGASFSNANNSTMDLELVRRTPISPSPVTTKLLAQRIIANAFNFLASFSSGGTGGNEVVPLKSFEEWWRKFEKKVERDPGFLERWDV